MKPGELFNRIPIVVLEDGKQVERELREKYHENVIVAYKMSSDYTGFVITKSLELYELMGTDDIISHIKANLINIKTVIDIEGITIVDKERFEEYKKKI